MGKPPSGGDKPATPLADDPTYQDLLDESLEETFPASDPISPSAGAERARQPMSNDKNDTDWQLEPGSESAPEATDADAAPRADDGNQGDDKGKGKGKKGKDKGKGKGPGKSSSKAAAATA